MRILPGCYGHVNDNHKEMEEKGIRYIQDCKTCGVLEECVAYYNALSYGGPGEDENDEDCDGGDWPTGEICMFCETWDACSQNHIEDIKEG